MKSYETNVFRIYMDGPGDLRDLEKLIGNGTIIAKDIVAIFAKTEGNGCVNDFTREYASKSFATCLSRHLGCSVEDVESKVALVMSGGTEGVLSPHATVFTRKECEVAQDNGKKRLAIGVSHTRDFLPEEIGRTEQIRETAVAVQAAMRDANILSYEDVHFIQIKCPLLTSERILAAKARNKTTVTEDTYGSMAFSRGASALAVAVGLEQIGIDYASENILSDWQMNSDVASASSGVELNHSVVVVLGNSRTSVSKHVISHSVMQDALDWKSVLKAFSNVGMDVETLMSDSNTNENTYIFAKAESSPDGLIRGKRHTMLDDSDIHSTRHARAAVGGIAASIAGTGAVYVSGGAEHQGPPGGGPIAVIQSVDAL